MSSGFLKEMVQLNKDEGFAGEWGGECSFYFFLSPVPKNRKAEASLPQVIKISLMLCKFTIQQTLSA